MTIPVSPALLMGLRDLVQSPIDAMPALETQLIMADLPILTLEGALPAEHLYVGDRVITNIGALPLQALMPVHIAQPLRLVHLEAYALGSDQTQHCDLFPSQLLKTRHGDRRPVRSIRPQLKATVFKLIKFCAQRTNMLQVLKFPLRESSASGQSDCPAPHNMVSETRNARRKARAT